jgi:succinate dehydrogenase hydrophobic anchor subunit
MGYFDALSSSGFKKDGSGRSVFYPWGALGKGRVLPDTESERRVRTFVVRYYIISMVVLAVIAMTAGWLFALIPVPFLMLGYHVRSRAMIRTWPEAGDRLTFRESYANVARAYNKTILWVFFVISILFAALGLLLLLDGSSPNDRVHGAVIILFFGLCAVLFGFMIRARRRR